MSARRLPRRPVRVARVPASACRTVRFARRGTAASPRPRARWAVASRRPIAPADGRSPAQLARSRGLHAGRRPCGRCASPSFVGLGATSSSAALAAGAASARQPAVSRRPQPRVAPASCCRRGLRGTAFLASCSTATILASSAHRSTTFSASSSSIRSFFHQRPDADFLDVAHVDQAQGDRPCPPSPA